MLTKFFQVIELRAFLDQEAGLNTSSVSSCVDLRSQLDGAIRTRPLFGVIVSTFNGMRLVALTASFVTQLAQIAFVVTDWPEPTW